MKRLSMFIFVCFFCVGISIRPATASLGGLIKPLAKKAVEKAIEFIGEEAGKSAVDLFKGLFNKDEEIKKRKAQIKEGKLVDNKRVWELSPGDLNDDDIKELAMILKAIDMGREQVIKTIGNGTKKTIATTESGDVVIGDHPVLTKSTGDYAPVFSSVEGGVTINYEISPDILDFKRRIIEAERKKVELEKKIIEAESKRIETEKKVKELKEKGKSATAKAFLNRDTDSNIRTVYNGALVAAVRKGDSATTKILLDRGTDANIKDQFSEPLLVIASKKGDAETVEALLAKGADVNAKDLIGNPVLAIAVEEKFADIVKLLVAKGADVNAKDWSGEPILARAIEKGLTDIVHILLNAMQKQ